MRDLHLNHHRNDALALCNERITIELYELKTQLKSVGFCRLSMRQDKEITVAGTGCRMQPCCSTHVAARQSKLSVSFTDHS
jgi:hypothetical protein